MGKRKVIADFGSFKSNLKKCPSVKALCKRTNSSARYTKGKIYDIENNRQNDYLILNDNGDLVPVSKSDFELLNEGLPISEVEEIPKNEEIQKTLNENRQTQASA